MLIVENLTKRFGANTAVDNANIAIDKPAGLLSVSTERQRERTALALVRTSLSRPGRRAQLWPVHRLDRETRFQGDGGHQDRLVERVAVGSGPGARGRSRRGIPHRGTARRGCAGRPCRR